EIEGLDRHATRAEAFEYFGLDPARMTLLVTGGSLGARRLNETIAASSPALVGTGWQLLHVTGERGASEAPTLEHHHAIAYCDRMDLACTVADLAVSRAGSATVSELTALSIPAVYVPLAIGNGEQRLNCRGAVDAGAAIAVANDDFTPDWVDRELVPLMLNRAALADMAAHAASI